MIGKLRFAFLIFVAVALSACATEVVREKATRFDQGIAAYDSGDFGGAYRIWSQLARENDLAAMRNTAQLLRQGKGVEKNAKQAFRLYLEAAEKGLVTAMANVAEMYFEGDGVDRNPQAAAAWYARAATAGLSLAQMKLSEMYAQGIGVDRDPDRSQALLERAARNGYVPAQAKLKAMGFASVDAAPSEEEPANLDDPWRGGGTITGVFKGTSEESISPGSAAPATGSNRMSPGEPVPAAVNARMPPQDLVQMKAGFAAYAAQDKPLAFATWRNVAARGNPEAQLRVGLMYEHGEGVGQDMIEAYRWLHLAADQDHPQAPDELSFVAAQLAPAERAIADSLVKAPLGDAPKSH
jgi:uncharacterized protein